MEKLFVDHGLALDSHQRQQLETYRDLLLQWNSKANLISKNDESRIVSRHFLESALLVHLDCFLRPVRILDLGSGGGFPGVPLKILRPHLNVTLLDSKRWKGLFLRSLVAQLVLEGATVVCGRAEVEAERADQKKAYDVVVSRAVAPLARLAELARPFLKAHGQMLAIKGQRVEDEIAALVELCPNVRVEIHAFPHDRAGLFAKQRIVHVEHF